MKKGHDGGADGLEGAERRNGPALRGLTEASATATLSRLGFRVSVSKIPAAQPKGIVVSQAPPPGTKAPKGSIVGINVSTGSNPAAGGVAVPKVVGLSQADAVDRIEQAGLEVNSFPVRSQQPQGTVVSELPAGGTQVPPGSDVRINVSLGPGAAPEARRSRRRRPGRDRCETRAHRGRLHGADRRPADERSQLRTASS